MGQQRTRMVLFFTLVSFALLIPLKSNQGEKATAIEIFHPRGSGVIVHEEWNRTWGSVEPDRGYGVWVNGSSIYTSGWTYKPGAGYYDVALVKWDADGNKIWERTWGGPSGDEAYDVAGNGTHVFTCGRSQPVGPSVSALSLIAWDADGNVVWNRTYLTGVGMTEGQSICIDNSYIYTCGYDYVVGPKDELLLIKWDFAGNMIWDRHWGGFDEDLGAGVCVDGGYVYTCGRTRSFSDINYYDYCLVKWDTDGNRLWNRTWGGNLDDIGLGVCANGSSIYVGGSTSSFGSGPSDFAVVKWETDGNLLWNRSWGGPDYDDCFSLSCIGSRIYAAGYSHVGSHLHNAIAIWDEDGNLLNATDWGGETYDNNWVADMVSNGTILYACGVTDRDSSGMSEDLLVMKLIPDITLDPPAITLFSPAQGGWYPIGQEILCNVTDRSETGLASVKYMWSDVPTSPDWASQGIPWLVEPYSTTIPTGPVGLVYLYVNATDNAGLSNIAYFSFQRDGQIPSVVLNSPSEGGSYAPETWIDCSVSDGSGVGLSSILYNWSTSVTPPDWAVDGVLWASPYNVQVPYGPTGALYLHLNATDLLNNQNCIFFSFLRDGASPIIALDNATETYWYAPGTVIDCRVAPQGGASVASVRYNWTTTTTPPDWVVDSTSWSEPFHAEIPVGDTGFVYLHVNATDTFGNNISRCFSFRRDGEVPSIVLNSPPKNTEIASGTTVDCSISDGVGSGLVLVKMLWSSSSTPPSWNTGGSEWTGIYDTTVPAGMTGQVYLHVFAIDATGNSYSTSFPFKISSTESGIPGIPLMELICFSILGVIFVALRRFRNKK